VSDSAYHAAKREHCESGCVRPFTVRTEEMQCRKPI
jgi:hypothetical protein